MWLIFVLIFIFQANFSGASGTFRVPSDVCIFLIFSPFAHRVPVSNPHISRCLFALCIDRFVTVVTVDRRPNDMPSTRTKRRRNPKRDRERKRKREKIASLWSFDAFSIVLENRGLETGSSSSKLPVEYFRKRSLFHSSRISYLSHYHVIANLAFACINFLERNCFHINEIKVQNIVLYLLLQPK